MNTRYDNAVELLDAVIGRSTAHYMDNAIDDQNFFLTRTQKLFDRIGNPEKKFKTIHIVGSSGKGSTSTMLYEIFRAHGKSVALYTSPHVTIALERIRWNGHLISPDAFADAVDRVMPILETIEKEDVINYPSYAEAFFAVAMLAFEKENIEWLILEAGCGGRYDKTNIIPAPITTVITPISIDHTAVLGDTIQHIASQKAGVMKAGSKIFSSETSNIVREILNAEAETIGVPLTYVQPEKEYTLQLLGPHQQANAALAAAAAVATDDSITQTNISLGLAAARLPARIEIMQENPRIIIDGAHSPAKIVALAETITTMEYDQLFVIFSLKETKDPQPTIAPIAQLTDFLFATSFQLQGFGSHPAERIASIFQELNPNLQTTVIPDAQEALSACLHTAGQNDLILVTGSLYAAGEIRQKWYPNEEIIRLETEFPESTTL